MPYFITLYLIALDCITFHQMMSHPIMSHFIASTHGAGPHLQHPILHKFSHLHQLCLTSGWIHNSIGLEPSTLNAAVMFCLQMFHFWLHHWVSRQVGFVWCLREEYAFIVFYDFFKKQQEISTPASFHVMLKPELQRLLPVSWTAWTSWCGYWSNCASIRFMFLWRQSKYKKDST